MKRLVFFILLLGWQFCQAQNRYIVLAESGLNIRELPDRNSKILVHLSFGKVVNSSVNFYSTSGKMIPSANRDTIDSVIGNWIDLHYEDISGYAFSPYLYVFTNLYKIDTLTDDSPIKFTREGFYVGNCEFIYHPKLNWFGLYMDSEGFSLRKVQTGLILSKVVGLDKFQDQDCLMPELPEGIVLETDKNDPSLFLFASTDHFTEGVIESPFYNFDLEYFSDQGFLYPEQIQSIEYNNNNYTFRAFDSVYIDNEDVIIKNYQLEVRKCHYTKEGEICEVINLSNHLNLYGTGRQHSFYKTPKINWTGDINKDGLLDFIIYQAGMAGHGGVEWRYTFFLSYIDESGILMYKTANNICWGCH